MYNLKQTIQIYYDLIIHNLIMNWYDPTIPNDMIVSCTFPLSHQVTRHLLFKKMNGEKQIIFLSFSLDYFVPVSCLS